MRSHPGPGQGAGESGNPPPPDDPPPIGAYLRAWRERALLTQEQLAERAGVSARTLRRLEAGEAGRPQTSTLRLLAGALGLSEAEQATLTAARGTPDAAAGPSEIAPPPPDDVPHQLPAPPPGFTGRVAELADLDRVQDATAVVITAIDGMAGIGKTALAVHAAHRLAGHFPDGQLFLDLHGHTEGVAPVAPAEAVERVLRTLGVSGPQIPEELDDRAALYRSRLAGRKVLVLLDNAAEETQVVPLLPGTPGCLVLVTSRRRLAGLDHTQTLSLDVLPLADATALFARSAGEHRVRGVPPGQVDEVVELCGRLPLAIRIAAARLRSRPVWTPAHLVDRLRDHHHRLTELGAGRRSVAAALDLSYRHLSPRLQRAYRLLGLHPGADLDTHAAAALIDADSRDAGRAIEHLVDAHLLQEPTAGRFRFHDLVRDHAVAAAARHEPGPARQAAVTRLLDHYRHTASVAMDLAHPYGRGRTPQVPPADTPAPPLAGPDRAGSWLDTELPNLLAAAHHAAEHGRPDHARHLSVTLHRHLRGNGHYADAEALHGRVVAATRATGNRAGELEALVCLGQARWLQGRLEPAASCYESALGIARAIGHPAGEVDALCGLADFRFAQGLFDEAAERFEGALELARRTADGIGELDALLGLGWTLMAQDRTATDVFERALDLARTRGDCTSELHALRALGHLHRLASRLDAATTCFEQALAIARAAGRRGGEVGALIGLAWVHRMQGGFDRSAACYRQALPVARQLGDLNWLFEILHGMGRLHHAAGDQAESIDLHQQALDVATGLGQPADEARAHDGLAHAHRALTRPEQARRHWQRALDILTELGVDVTEDAEATAPTIRAHLAELAGPGPGR
ncbi:MAG TPA: tetratricopeptide repeat protein [Pseudonocardia sp.]|nr:tetratricopeptide repeat protein [Pseudonocardia sp.]